MRQGPDKVCSAIDFDRAPTGQYVVGPSKAPSYQDGHAGYSDPLDEQTFLTTQINAIEKSPEWSSTAIVIAYDDSDGWYDHVSSPIVNGSHDAANDQPLCTSTKAALSPASDRCGNGPRLPLLVISPWSKRNYVDNAQTDQSSIVKFIENNWSLGRIGNGSYDTTAGTLSNMFDFRQVPNPRPLILDTKTGAVQN